MHGKGTGCKECLVLVEDGIGKENQVRVRELDYSPSFASEERMGRVGL
jgi:CRISPR/Cas system-associated protein Cas5 (RAMP superfamily)